MHYSVLAFLAVVMTAAPRSEAQNKANTSPTAGSVQTQKNIAELLRCPKSKQGQGGDHSQTCHDGYVVDDKGNKVVITSDSIRNGQNSAVVDEKGVEITTGGKTYTGEYFENKDSVKEENVNGETTFVDHNPITLAGKEGSAVQGFSLLYQ